MSERGVFAVDRGIWDHDLFFDGEPFSRREAWLWLVSEAAWKERSRRIAGRHIELQRGQLVASLRFIASKWRWSEPRVRRFISALISEQMIDAKTDAGVTVINICNYDNYQRVSLPSDAIRESHDDAEATQQRRGSDAAATQNKDIKNIKLKDCTIARKKSYSEEFELQFWQPYPRTPTMSKAEAWKVWIKLASEDRTSACEAIEPYKRFLKSKPNLETVHACRFLSQRRFEGFKEAAPAQVFDIRSHLV